MTVWSRWRRLKPAPGADEIARRAALAYALAALKEALDGPPLDVAEAPEGPIGDVCIDVDHAESMLVGALSRRVLVAEHFDDAQAMLQQCLDRLQAMPADARLADERAMLRRRARRLKQRSAAVRATLGPR